MAFKKMDNSLGFADLVLESSRKHNRSLKNMKKLDKSIDWSRIDTILKSHYTVIALQMSPAPKVVSYKFRPRTGRPD